MGNSKSKKDTSTDNHPANPSKKSLSVGERICSTRAEICGLLWGIEQFQGTTENDKQYKYLDEMLTRCFIKLDEIECNNLADRDNRKQAIKGINKALAILERKLEINSDIRRLENDLTNSDLA